MMIALLAGLAGLAGIAAIVWCHDDWLEGEAMSERARTAGKPPR